MAKYNQFLCTFIQMVLLFCYCHRALAENQFQFFAQMKKSFSGKMLSNWEAMNGTTNGFCSYYGVRCNEKGNIEEIDISGWSLSGKFPDDVCLYLPELRILRIGNNNLSGSLPVGITNCSLLETLDLRYAQLTGTLPDLSPLHSLRFLDFSYNVFQGKFPVSLTNLTNLEIISFNANPWFDSWELTESISRLTNLRYMILNECNIHGEIPTFIGNLTSLVTLELIGNSLAGHLPRELRQLKILQELHLYRNNLEGEISEELGNMTELTQIDISGNKLTKLPESIFRLPKLSVLQLYDNYISGEISTVLGNSTTLTMLSLYNNFLTGELPENLGKFSPLVGFDLSENKLSGELPQYVCNGGKLMYFLVLQNEFTGQIPKDYAKCNCLLRFRVAHNQLEGSIPEGLFALRHASIIDLSDNRLTGSFPITIENALNLSELNVQNNMISGSLPSEISRAINLEKIYLSNNLLSGPIPPEIGQLRKLNFLVLQRNKFNSSIPESLSLLRTLYSLDLSNNNLSGSIPESLTDLLPNRLNFSNNMLSGPIPGVFVLEIGLNSFSGNPSLCVPTNLSTFRDQIPLCPKTHNHKRSSILLSIGLPVVVVAAGITLFLKLWFKKDKPQAENTDTLLSSIFSDHIQIFHHGEIIQSMIDTNIIGRGGFGTVYKVELSTGVTVAVKKLHSKKICQPEDQSISDKELKTEVDALGKIWHKTIVKLYCYFSSAEGKLLVYEYMPNGNLWDALHGGKILLHWPARYQIASGAAQGLAYLHHHLPFPVIHRDIKSSNILLDGEYQPKLADFGLAKILGERNGKDSITTGVVGTFGYLDPDYVNTLKASIKSDVYSFGVELMELVTGRQPVESLFGEGKNIVHWIQNKVVNKEAAFEVLDERISDSFEEGMIKVLRLAIHCTHSNKALRPNMKEVVQLLIDADPFGGLLEAVHVK